MKFQIFKNENFTVLTLQEAKLTSTIAKDLKTEFIQLNTLGAQHIILNLGDVSYADSSGLSAILIGNRLCKSSGGTLILCCLSAHVEKLINISQLNNVLNICPTEEEAREAIFMFILESQIEGESTDEKEEIPSEG